MSLVREVRRALADAQDVKPQTGEKYDLADALLEAERLSDAFHDVHPQPYVVPIERYAGLPVMQKSNASKGRKDQR